MKTLRRFCAVTILSLTLAGSVLAGHMDTMGAVPPPPPSATSTSTSITTTVILTIIGLIR